MARESICLWKKKGANAKILGHINLRFWLPRHLLLCPYVCLCISPLIYFFLQFLPSSTSQIFAYRMARRLLRKGNRKIRSGTGWDFLIATFLGFVFVKIAAMEQSKIKFNRYNNRTSFQLTLLGPEGGQSKIKSNRYKGSHPKRKVQFFLTLFKRPLTPPPLLFEHLSYFAGGVF